MHAVNGIVIEAQSKEALTHKIKLRRSFTWHFDVADVSSPIIDADLLKHYGLLADMRNRSLLHPETKRSSEGFLNTVNYLGVSSVGEVSCYHNSLGDLPCEKQGFPSDKNINS